MPLSISMIWPRPPRVRPAPPESGRSSFLQKISGVIALGDLDRRALDARRVGGSRQPVLASAARRCRRWRSPPWRSRSCRRVARALWPRTLRFHRQEVPSAGTRSGIAWRRQPNTTSGSIWPMTWRDATGAGFGALRIAALGRRDGQRQKRAGVVGDARRDDAAEAEHGVGGGVGERHVDAARRGRPGARRSRRGCRRRGSSSSPQA